LPAKEKKTSVFRFRSEFAENKRKLPISVDSVFCLRKHGDMETWRHKTCRHGKMATWKHSDMDMETSNGKCEREAQAIFLIRLLFVQRANGSLSFVRLLAKKQAEVIRLQTDLAIYGYLLHVTILILLYLCY
jgi:hypothetical protein